ncbi:MAG: twin-arginine translocase TatA/TatE family subunit [Alphaproteobacteria bacterium]|nr:twin-arginine translocase TatA/TatE family subunit [Alphaproteobacteria bacterium]
MFGRFGAWEILIIVLLVVVLFGHAKIPGMMKNLADGVKVFKKEMKDTESEKESASKKATVKKATAKKSAPKKAVAKKAKTKKSVTKK